MKRADTNLTAERSLSPKPWPEYFPHAQDTLIAVGAIALSYGQLENTLKRVFCAATGMKYNDLSSRFHKWNNDERKRRLTELLPKADILDRFKADVVSFWSTSKLARKIESALSEYQLNCIISSMRSWENSLSRGVPMNSGQ
jgi:hypothetical protein